MVVVMMSRAGVLNSLYVGWMRCQGSRWGVFSSHYKALSEPRPCHCPNHLCLCFPIQIRVVEFMENLECFLYVQVGDRQDHMRVKLRYGFLSNRVEAITSFKYVFTIQLLFRFLLVRWGS